MSANQRAVLGSILFRQENLYAAQQAGITEQSFSDESCRRAWVAINALVAKGKAVDSITVARETGIDGTMLEGFIDACPAPSSIASYAAMLRDEEKADQASRRMTVATEELTATTDPARVIDETIGDLMQINKNSDIKVRTLGDMREGKVAQWRQAMDTGFVGVPFCIASVCKYLGGWRNGCVSIIAGYRGEGKSTLARQDAYANAVSGRKVALFTLEDPADIAAASIAARHVGLSTFYADTGSAMQATIDKLDAGWREIENLPLYLIDSQIGITQICSVAMMLHMRHKLDIMYLDHVQYIAPLVLKGLSRNDTLSSYSLALSGLAKRLNIPIVILAQLNRDAERNNRKPRLSDIRDCGSLEQDARQVLMLWREQDATTHQIEVAKNNFGISGKAVNVWRLDGKNQFTDNNPNGPAEGEELP